MPIIIRIESDMFVFSDVADYMVNPTNCVGVMGKGLALEFRNRTPAIMEPYRQACRDNSLRVGTVQILEDSGQDYGVINFPSKRHYADTSSKEDIVRGLEALREILQSDKYKYASIGMPMLGCGLGRQDYDTVFPLMIDHLGDLEATIFLSMSPERTEKRPKYLVIVGPPDYGLTPSDCDKIDEIIDKSLDYWGVSINDYEGIVTGGYAGVDQYIGGKHFLKDVEDTYCFKKTGKPSLVVQPNRLRNGVGSIMKHHHLLCEIGDDFIMFKPEGHNNNRMSLMQRWIKNDREKRHLDGHSKRRVSVFGVTDTNLVDDKLLVK